MKGKSRNQSRTSQDGKRNFFRRRDGLCYLFARTETVDDHGPRDAAPVSSLQSQQRARGRGPTLDLWSDIVASLEATGQISPENLAVYFQATSQVRYEQASRRLVVRVPNNRFSRWISNQYGDLLEAKMEELGFPDGENRLPGRSGRASIEPDLVTPPVGLLRRCRRVRPEPRIHIRRRTVISTSSISVSGAMAKLSPPKCCWC